MRGALLSLSLLAISCSADGGEIEAIPEPESDGGAFDAAQAADAAIDDARGDAASSDAARADADASADAALPPQGLRAEYFEGFDRDGANPRVVRVDPDVDFDWSTTAPAATVSRTHFSVRWTGEIIVPRAETYTFETRSDDGVRLVIDDDTVLENWTGHFATTDSGTKALTAGAHRIRLEYFQLDLGAELRLFWSSPNTPRALVPKSVLRPADAPSTGRAPAPPYVNPVRPQDCPDPGVMRVEEGGRAAYYMACTGGPFTIFRSPDSVRWTASGGSILPSGKASWSANGNRNWAPELHQVGSKFIAYFTAVNAADKLAIGVASADAPTGPYTVKSTPLVDDPNPGVIDATYFRDDDGKHYLYWKRDGNQNGNATPMFVRELAADGLSFAAGSTATQVLTNDPGTWEGGVVEAPWVVKRGGTYYMFYSANVYDARYRTGVARGPSAKGPFTKKGAPILVNNADFLGPGHGSVVQAHGADFFVYHAWLANASGAIAPGGRQVLVDAITRVDGWPKIANGSPSSTPQAYP